MASTPARPIPEIMREYLRYDPETGDMFWTKAPCIAVRAGARAGRLDSQGYRQIGFQGRRYAAHRVAWFLATGAQPPEMLDHKDCDRSNNRLVNLRAATRRMNSANVLPKGRYLKGVSQGSVAEAVGCDQSAVSLWEQGKTSPSGSARILLQGLLARMREMPDAQKKGVAA